MTASHYRDYKQPKEINMDKNLENTLSDMISNLLYYDRKEDDELPIGKIEKMVRDGNTSFNEIMEVIGQELKEGLD
jgi:predicted DNA-binding ArsR family transcriptional regulator